MSEENGVTQPKNLEVDSPCPICGSEIKGIGGTLKISIGTPNKLICNICQTKYEIASSEINMPKNLGELKEEDLKLASYPIEKETIKAVYDGIRDLLEYKRTKLTNKMKQNNSCATIECKQGKIALIGSKSLFKDDMTLLSNIKLIEDLAGDLLKSSEKD